MSLEEAGDVNSEDIISKMISLEMQIYIMQISLKRSRTSDCLFDK